MCKAALPGIIAAALWLTQAQAQSDNGNAIAVPPAPAIVASPPAAPVAPTPPPAPPELVQTPLPPPSTTDNTDTGTANASAGTPDNAAAAPPAPTQPPAGAAPTLPSDWVNGKTAEIRVLDKVDGSIADLTIPVGGQSVSGDLQVSVLACDLHSPGELPDDAIFVSIQPTADPSAPPVYRGWMVRSVPAAAVVGDASETFRVMSCS